MDEEIMPEQESEKPSSESKPEKSESKSEDKKEAKMEESMQLSSLSQSVGQLGLMNASAAGAAMAKKDPWAPLAVGALVGAAAGWFFGRDTRRDGYGYGNGAGAVEATLLADRFNGQNVLTIESANSTQRQASDYAFANQAALNGIQSNMNMQFCQTNHNIQSSECKVLGAIAADGAATRALITNNEIQALRDKNLMLELDRRQPDVVAIQQQIGALGGTVNQLVSVVNGL